MHNVLTELAELFCEKWNEEVGPGFYGLELAPIHINSGWCYQFAALLNKLYPDSIIFTDMAIGHCWIELNGEKLECPQARNYEECHRIEQTFEEMADFWDDKGYSGRLRLDIIDKVMLEWSETRGVSQCG